MSVVIDQMAGRQGATRKNVFCIFQVLRAEKILSARWRFTNFTCMVGQTGWKDEGNESLNP
jgi:hypothetical protein